MKNICLGLAIIGTAVPYAEFVPPAGDQRFDLCVLVSEMFIDQMSNSFSIDVIVFAIFGLVLAAGGTQRGVRSSWLVIGGSMAERVSVNLPGHGTQ